MKTSLEALGLYAERVDDDGWLVSLEGAHVYLLAGEQDVTVECFVVHVLEGASLAEAHRLLLRANLGLRQVHFALDDVGDVFLRGSLSLRDVTPRGVDVLLGEVVSALEVRPRLLRALYGSAVPEKALLDGAGRRTAGLPEWAPRRDLRR